MVLSLVAALVAGCAVPIQGGLSERDANEAVVVLRAEGVVASKAASAGGQFAVEVPRAQADRALSVLVSWGLPRRETAYASLLEESGGIVPSAQTERARRAALVGASVEETLIALDGVHDAFVHVVLPAENSALVARSETSRPRVAVVLVASSDAAPPDDAVRAITMGAVDGLEPEDVAVVRSRIRLPEVAPPALVAVGPFAVATESAAPLRMVLRGAGAMVLLLSLGLGFAVIRPRRSP